MQLKVQVLSVLVLCLICSAIHRQDPSDESGGWQNWIPSLGTFVSIGQLVYQLGWDWKLALELENIQFGVGSGNRREWWKLRPKKSNWHRYPVKSISIWRPPWSVLYRIKEQIALNGFIKTPQIDQIIREFDATAKRVPAEGTPFEVQIHLAENVKDVQFVERVGNVDGWWRLQRKSTWADGLQCIKIWHPPDTVVSDISNTMSMFGFVTVPEVYHIIDKWVKESPSGTRSMRVKRVAEKEDATYHLEVFTHEEEKKEKKENVRDVELVQQFGNVDGWWRLWRKPVSLFVDGFQSVDIRRPPDSVVSDINNTMSMCGFVTVPEIYRIIDKWIKETPSGTRSMHVVRVPEKDPRHLRVFIHEDDNVETQLMNEVGSTNMWWNLTREGGATTGLQYVAMWQPPPQVFLWLRVYMATYGSVTYHQIEHMTNTADVKRVPEEGTPYHIEIRRLERFPIFKWLFIFALIAVVACNIYYYEYATKRGQSRDFWGELTPLWHHRR